MIYQAEFAKSHENALLTVVLNLANLSDTTYFIFIIYFFPDPPVLNFLTFLRLLTLAAFFGKAGFIVVRFLFLLANSGSLPFFTVCFSALGIFFNFRCFLNIKPELGNITEIGN